MSKDVAVAETAMAIDREGRVIGHFVVEIETAEPPKGEMKLDILTQLALEADAVAVANDQHPEHQLGIDRRPADLTVEGLQSRPKFGQDPRHDWIEAAQKMMRRNAVFQVERIKQSTLIAGLPPHHDPTPPPKPQSNGITARLKSRALFSTASTHCRPRNPSLLIAHRPVAPIRIPAHAAKCYPLSGYGHGGGLRGHETAAKSR